MITLFRKNSSDKGLQLRGQLNELVIAYREEILPETSDRKVYILDGGREYSGDIEIEQWLTGLKRELQIQRSVTGDACYLDPETGEVC